MKSTRADVVLVQEHKRRGQEALRNARAEARREGWRALLAEAGMGEAEASGGVGCLVREHLPAQMIPKDAGPHAARWQPYLVAGGGARDLLLVSVYGYSGEGTGPKNRGRIEETGFWAGLSGRAPPSWLGAIGT